MKFHYGAVKQCLGTQVKPCPSIEALTCFVKIRPNMCTFFCGSLKDNFNGRYLFLVGVWINGDCKIGNFHSLGPPGQVSHRVGMAVYLCVCLCVPVIAKRPCVDL